MGLGVAEDQAAGAQLIVRPGQSAVFVHQGQIADVFGPGHYRLETKNMPLLSTLMGWMHGFDSPFKAEVYFVSTRQLTDLKWGTSNPVPLRDADFGPVRVRAGSRTRRDGPSSHAAGTGRASWAGQERGHGPP